jgi:hypothetical protein
LRKPSATVPYRQITRYGSRLKAGTTRKMDCFRASTAVAGTASQCFNPGERGQLKDQILIRFVPVVLGLMIGAAPAVAAVEQCRFIQAKPEREACYQRQAIALAAKRKPEPEPTADTRTLETLQQMRRDDDEVYKSLRSICRGC